MHHARPTQNQSRVLQYTYGGSHISGIDSYLLDASRALEGTGIEFDYLFRYACPYPDAVAGELVERGSAVDSLGVREADSPLRRQWVELQRLRAALRRRRPDAVEINMTSTFMVLSALLLARRAGATYRIVHAHDSYPGESRAKRVLKRLATPLVNSLATDRWACSRDAARYLFGDAVLRRGDWTLVRNAIDAKTFDFDAKARQDLRDEWGLNGSQLAVGVIGRFMPQKNQIRALAIFQELLKIRDDAVLIFVGDGQQFDDVAKAAGRLDVDPASIIFLGSRQDMPRIYSALDVVLAPSIHEGFPIAALEAQASGLPLVVSSAFPQESDLRSEMRILDLRTEDREWARALNEAHQGTRQSGAASVVDAGHDRSTLRLFLERAYGVALGRP